MEERKIRKALRYAFPLTIPIMAGFGFLGFTYGVYMRVSGFAAWYPVLTALIVFGGSLEFVIVTMLLSPFAPLQTFLMAFLIQARHLFYGIAMLDKYKDTGWKKFHLIFCLCDESFSINCSAEIPEDVDRGWFYLTVSFLNRAYWITSVTAGALFGGLVTFSTKGIDFVMTAMFVVIFLEQLLKEKRHISSAIGLLGSIACLLLFGPDSFLIPSMIVIVTMLTLFRKPMEKTMEVVK